MFTQASFDHRPVRRCRTRAATVWTFGWGLGGALVLTPSVQAQLAVAPNASGSAVGTSLPIQTIPLNIPGTYTFPPPPAAFDPETASRGATQAYGLPGCPISRPTRKRMPAGLMRCRYRTGSPPSWKKRMSIISHTGRRRQMRRPPIGAEQQLTESPVEAVAGS